MHRSIGHFGNEESANSLIADCRIYTWIQYNFTNLAAYHGYFPPDILAEIRRHDSVAHIELDENFEQDWEPTTEAEPLEDPRACETTPQKRDPGTQYANAGWNLRQMSEASRYDGLEGDARYNGPFNYDAITNAGNGVDVYVLDTGVRTTHVDFLDSTVYPPVTRANFLASYFPGSESDTGDVDGHGTSMASVIVGQTFGIARSANVFSIKMAGSVNGSVIRVNRIAVVKGMDLVINHQRIRKQTQGSGFHGSIVNMSWKSGSRVSAALENTSLVTLMRQAKRKEGKHSESLAPSARSFVRASIIFCALSVRLTGRVSFADVFCRYRAVCRSWVSNRGRRSGSLHAISDRHRMSPLPFKAPGHAVVLLLISVERPALTALLQ